MKLNCDLGESFGAWTMGQDELVMPLIDMANIACGFHASDPQIMVKTVALAQDHQVTIGAHPAYPDLAGFGRRSMACTPEEVRSLLLYQIGALDGICRAMNTRVRYVKPHGALYNDMMAQPDALRAVMQATRDYGDLELVIPTTLRHQKHRRLAESLGLSILFEAFADRAYDDLGHLIPRSQPGSVLHDTDAIVNQATGFARDGGVMSASGQWLALPADTLCIHGDNDESIQAARSIRDHLDALS